MGLRLPVLHAMLVTLSAVLGLEYVGRLMSKGRVFVSQNFNARGGGLKIVLIALASCLISFTCLRGVLALNLTSKNIEEGSTNNRAEIEVIITEQPRVKHEYVSYTATPLWGGGIKMLIYGKRYPVYMYGSHCELSGYVQKSSNLENVGYAQYLIDRRIGYLVYPDTFECEERSDFWTGLIKAKYRVIEIVEKEVPEPQASLIIGILFGDNRDFSEEFGSAVMVTGTSHVVAASGFNVAFVSALFDKAFFLFKRKIRFVPVLIGVWLYCFVASFSASIVRATASFTIKRLSEVLGVPISPNYVLVLTVFIMLVANPLYIKDYGFILSLAAVIGLMYLTPFIKEKLGVKSEAIASSLACYISTLPVLVLLFSKIPIISLVVNPLILFLVDDVMLLGIVGILVHGIHPLLGKFLLWICWVLMYCFEQIVLIFSRLKFGLIGM